CPTRWRCWIVRWPRWPTPTPGPCQRQYSHRRCRPWNGRRPGTPRRGLGSSAFTAQDGYECDGQGSARTWLRWQARVTRGASAARTAWARRLAAHPVVAQALADGEISASWARELCDWSDRLPVGKREDADAILTGAARAGAELADLAGLA